MSSAERICDGAIVALAALLAAGLLAGCATTQQEAARLQLNSARIRASAAAVRVTREDPQLAVGPVELIRGAARCAVLVVIRNRTDRPLSDLPVSVGIRDSRGAPRYLNAIAGLPYFGAHVAGIAAHGTLRWVFTTARLLPAHARPFARVGFAQPGLAPAPRLLPAIDAVRIRSTALGGDSSELSLVVRNLSGVPQYQLPVYAFVQRGRTYLAAGGAMIAHLASDASTTLRLRLLGASGGARVQVEAPPTIFQ
ncbi:MAG: hypothetical protein ACLP01_12310 [Solirubrobacteraceae bacterium]